MSEVTELFKHFKHIGGKIHFKYKQAGQIEICADKKHP